MTSLDLPALSAHGLSKRFGRDRWALRDVSIDIPPGSISGLIGPNGAGKTTLMRLWMGFDRPSSGAARVMGQDPLRSRVNTLAQVAYVPQGLAFYRGLTVADHLEVACHYRGAVDRPSIERRLDTLGIRLGATVGSLSGGQASQLAIAIAFGLGARVLLLDEPFGSLDPLARAEALGFLIDLTHDAGATVVLSSHVIEDITAACNHVVVLGNGRLLYVDSMASAVASHTVSPDVPSSEAALISDVGSVTPPRRLWRLPASSNTYPASLNDVVLGYLALGRSTDGAPP